MNFICGGWLALSLFALVFALTLTKNTPAQEHRERTIDEIKTEAIKRAENGMYPLIGLDPADVREAFASIKSADNDEWAAGFSRVADRYMAQGKALEGTDPAKASAAYVVGLLFRDWGARWKSRLQRIARGARVPSDWFFFRPMNTLENCCVYLEAA